VSLSPEHIHTAFLHLDDYTDVNSAGNEWIQWLISNHRESLKTDENEKLAYCETYAKVKCRKKVSMKGPPAEATLRELKRRMSRYEIISLRCIAMEETRKIPKSGSDDELAAFLKTSCSSIVKNNDIGLVPFDEPFSPFERNHHCALRALVALIREKYSFLAPAIPVTFQCGVLYTDFPNDTNEMRNVDLPIPSSIGSHGVRFSLDLNDLLFAQEHVWLKTALEIQEIEWSVLMSDQQVPSKADNAPIGIIYKVISISMLDNSHDHD
jgi:hypothetical protein